MRIHGKKWRCALLMWVACCGACGPGLIDDSFSTDITEGVFPDHSSDPIVLMDISADTDTGNNEEICPGAVTSECEPNIHLFATPQYELASTEWLDAPARFSHFVKDVIVGHFDDAANTPFAVQIDFEDLSYAWALRDEQPVLEPLMTLANNDSMDNQWIGVVSHSKPVFDSSFFYVGVLRQGDTYQPVGIPMGDDDAALSLSGWPALDTTASLTGAVYLASKTRQPDASLNTLCLHGEGVFCFDGETWRTELSPDGTPTIVAMAVSNVAGKAARVHAVGDNGTIFTRTDGDWSKFVMADAPRLASASVNEETGLLSVAGTHILARGDAHYMMAPCEHSLDIIEFRYYRESPEFVALDKAGHLYTGEFDATFAASICGPLHTLEDARGVLPVGSNLYVLTEFQLFGTTDQLGISLE